MFPADVFHDEVQEFAHHVASLPAEAVGLATPAIDAARNDDRRTTREIDRLARSPLFASPDFVERQRAFGADPAS